MKMYEMKRQRRIFSRLSRAYLVSGISKDGAPIACGHRFHVTCRIGGPPRVLLSGHRPTQSWPKEMNDAWLMTRSRSQKGEYDAPRCSGVRCVYRF